jgi:PAS domain S-box-containing protein
LDTSVPGPTQGHILRPRPIANERAVADAVLAGGSEMGALMRSIDWSATPLGPVSGWPQALRTTVGLLLRNRFPLLLWWGPRFVQLYNDAYRPIPGARHPRSMGQPASECWDEIWHVIGPMIEAPFRGEPATWSDDLELFITRHGFLEETHFKVAYSPVPDETAAPTGIGGVLATVAEITEQVYGERQLRTLRELGARAADAKTPEEACVTAAATFASSRDVPFALLYLLEDGGRTARLAAAHGLRPGEHPAAPAAIDLAAPASAGWPLEGVVRERRIEVIDDLQARFRELPSSEHGSVPRHALALPLAAPDQPRVYGFLLAGVSPHRTLSEGYRSFFELAAAQLVTAIRNARAYQEERQRATALAEIDRAKTAFFSNISHEFRTPLTLMLGPMEDALPSRALTGDDLDAAHRNALRLHKLVNALLDFSRIEAGRMQASYAPTDIARATSELAGMFESAMQRAGLRFLVRCAPIAEPVYLDGEMYEKIVLNLLSNALKFTFEGEIEVGLQDVGESVELTVRDTGIGVSAEELPRLFERFHRVEGIRARTHEGSGIGLAMVSDLVKLHGGAVRAESAAGRGTSFTVRLPKGMRHLPADKIGAPRGLGSTTKSAFIEEALRWLPGVGADTLPSVAAAPAQAGKLSGCRVLVADDNADMRDYLMRLLSPHWTVEAVPDGAAALARARERPPDLLLTDVMMPNLDGFGLLRALRADRSLAGIPVLMLSARAGEEAYIQGLEAGADDYIVKPFSGKELIARVQAQLVLAASARERQVLLQREQEARREAELQKEHLFALFSQAPMPMVILRGERMVVELANEPACRVWGRRPEAVIDRPLLEVLPELKGQVFEELLARVFATGEPYSGKEARAKLDRNGDGRLEDAYFNFIYTPMRDAQGSVAAVLVVAFDVTDEVNAREQMARLRTEAERANRSKDEFLAVLGHELRNPLAPILTALHLMRLRGVDKAEKERTVIERQAHHLVRLVDDLLDVSRITRGKVALRKQRIELGRIVAKAIEMASPLLEQRQHELIVEVEARGLLVDADPERMAQVISNLLANAAKYTEKGGRITVAAASTPAGVTIRVSDTGIGIAPEMIPRVFDMFVQERQALDRSQGGLGLGLTIVRSLVALHGGAVEARSEGRNKGAEFTIHLPSSAEREEPAAGPGEAAALATDGRTRRILVVDDNEDAADMLAGFLQEMGHTTRIARDGPEALKMVAEFAPDLALLDIGLPVMDGYELARRLREGARRIGLVAVTGYGQKNDRKRSQAAGFDAHLVKPVSVERLASLIQELTESQESP